jgi:hypothetical protein
MSHVTQKTATTRINARRLSAMCIENPRVGSSILPQATILCVVAQENVLQISVART